MNAERGAGNAECGTEKAVRGLCRESCSRRVERDERGMECRGCIDMSDSSDRRLGAGRSSGFTLLELLLAITIMVAVMTVVYLAFSTVTKAWRRGMVLVDNLHHGDFALEELTMALRSAYYPDALKGKASDYGFRMEDSGSGEYAGDTISWVKLGRALVGDDCPFAGSAHRVSFSVQENDEGERVASVKAWRLHGQPEDFDPDEVEPVTLSRRIVGFDCRPAYLPKEEDDGEIEWLDEWENTNEIPALVNITLYLDPLDEDESPVEIKRIVRIPTAHLSWK